MQETYTHCRASSLLSMLSTAHAHCRAQSLVAPLLIDACNVQLSDDSHSDGVKTTPLQGHWGALQEELTLQYSISTKQVKKSFTSKRLSLFYDPLPHNRFHIILYIDIYCLESHNTVWPGACKIVTGFLKCVQVWQYFSGVYRCECFSGVLQLWKYFSSAHRWGCASLVVQGLTVPFSHLVPVQPVKQWHRKSPFLSSQRTIPLGLQGDGEHWSGMSETEEEWGLGNALPPSQENDHLSTTPSSHASYVTK